jgi:hypothetical protein
MRLPLLSGFVPAVPPAVAAIKVAAPIIGPPSDALHGRGSALLRAGLRLAPCRLAVLLSWQLRAAAGAAALWVAKDEVNSSLAGYTVSEIEANNELRLSGRRPACRRRGHLGRCRIITSGSGWRCGSSRLVRLPHR